MKVRCLLCEAKIQNTFADKWKHALKKHPDEMFSKLLSMAFQSDVVREQGQQIGMNLRNEVLTKFRGGR